MAKGIKRVKHVGGQYYPKMSNPITNVIIVPDAKALFMVSEWLPDTTAADKAKNVTWIWQESSRKIIIKKSTLSSQGRYEVIIPKKLCGPYLYYLEASLSGKWGDANNAGLFVGGWCEQRVINSKWSVKHNGADVRKSVIFSYGQNVHLNLSTEGLNGSRVTIEIYNIQMGFDKNISTYPNVPVVDGQVNLEIKDTAAWMPLIRNIQNEEKFYIKAKNSQGKYVLDNNKDDEHARYLRIRKELLSANTAPPENHTPAVVNQPTPNPVRYEPCKFDIINIAETKEESGKIDILKTTVFNEGKGLLKVSYPKNYLTRTIYFDFGSFGINSTAKNMLNNLLSFILNYEGSNVVISGYACVIGTQDYNRSLSQKRSDAVSNFFKSGGIDPRRMTSRGYGEINPTDDKSGRDNIQYKDEKKNKELRKVVISFDYKGHDAASILYQTVAPGVSIKKDLTIEILNFITKECSHEKDKHQQKFTMIDIGQKVDSGDKPTTHTSPAVIKIYSDISSWNAFPLQYIWPIATTPNKFWLHIHSCRYYSNRKNPTVKIEVYPDIKWELALQILVKVSNYKAQNMPAGNIYARHNERAREAGYERFLLNEHGKVPISIGVGLSAAWDDGKHKRSITNEFSTTVKTLAESIAQAANILQETVNYAQSAAKATSIPIGFDIRYPKFTIVGSWYLEPYKGKVAVVGDVAVGFEPLIGAEVVIDILGCAIAALSYGTTGNPAAARIINKFRGGLEKLGASVVFTATFYGELHIIIEALKIHSIKGIEMSGKTTIEGRLGVLIELSISIEVGRRNSATTRSRISFAAAARGTAEGYFGGAFEINSDEKGLYIQPILKFSGILLSVEITGEIGWWECSLLKIEETVVDKAEYFFEKKYVVNK